MTTVALPPSCVRWNADYDGMRSVDLEWWPEQSENPDSDTWKLGNALWGKGRWKVTSRGRTRDCDPVWRDDFGPPFTHVCGPWRSQYTLERA